MALLTILKAPDKRLKQKSVAVPRVDDGVRQLMDDMLETMYAAPGIGLAAPQVGVLQRVIVVDVTWSSEEKVKRPFFLANPEIVATEGEITWEEGCLSVPENVGDVVRAARVKVHAWDRQGQEVTIDAGGLLAVCLQHEIDHLNGVLFIDHLSRLKREIILKKLRRMQAEES
ncbi:MAG: peptide deformylase [Magnetococcales bacterium]|nr:peptide deformylase [Magnetococcales bacterium]